ncbi:MAG: hypothetical protein V3T56_03060, partial [Gemmatimonadales bacterium]
MRSHIPPPHLVGEHGHLPGESEQIRDGCEHRHRQHRVTGDARNGDVQSDVSDHHAECGDRQREVRHRREDSVDDRVDDV